MSAASPWCGRSAATGGASALAAVPGYSPELSRLVPRFTCLIPGRICFTAAAIAGCLAPPPAIAATLEDDELEEGIEVGKVEV